MAKIVCIDTGTVRTGCEIGDIVAVHDDDVLLDGSGYSGFKIYDFPGLKAADVRSKMAAKLPETSKAYKASSIEWSLFTPEEKEVWKDDAGNWCDLASRPKYGLTLFAITEAQKTSLADSKSDEINRLLTLDSALTEKIHLDSSNLIAIAALNKTAASEI
jgi:hypothetical protein